MKKLLVMVSMLVCKFTGPGKVYTQSRNPGSFGAWVGGVLPAQG